MKPIVPRLFSHRNNLETLYLAPARKRSCWCFLLTHVMELPEKRGTDHHSGSKRSYKDALQWQIPQSGPRNTAPAQDGSMTKLKASLRTIMCKHPEGVSLAQIRRCCPLLHDPGLLEGFASSKQLLASLTDVVRLQGIGVQTRVYPAAAAQT